MVFTALVITLSAANIPWQPVLAAPGDYSWQKAGTNLVGDTILWTSITSSSDGTKLAAVAETDTYSPLLIPEPPGLNVTFLTPTGRMYITLLGLPDRVMAVS